LLKQLPRWFRHMLGFVALLIAMRVAFAFEATRGDWITPLAGLILGILAWIYIAKAGEFKKKD